MASQKKVKNIPYGEKEKDRHVDLLEKRHELFDGDNGWGLYNKYAKYSYFLQQGENNFYKVIRDKYINEKPMWDTISEFFKNGYNIDLHSPSDTVSSQVACLNHLFPIRQNKKAILAILKNIDKEITDVVSLGDKNHNDFYVGFEIYDSEILGESTPTRVDALIFAKKDKKPKGVTLVVIEWKYTECNSDDKSKGEVGERRKAVYNRHLGAEEKDSKYIRSYKSLGLKDIGAVDKIYYREPFYQLMRETLWAEALIEGKNKINNSQITNKDIIFGDYIHIHVVPNGNQELRREELRRRYFSDKSLEETWMACLSPEGKERYKIITPKKLFEPLVNNPELLEEQGSPIKDAADFIEYLRIRYWQEK